MDSRRQEREAEIPLFLEGLAALAEPTRLRILALLGRSGPMNVGSIASHFEISRPAISYHLRTLRVHGLIEKKRVGQETHYWVDIPSVAGSLRLLADRIEAYHGSEDEKAREGERCMREETDS